MLPISADDHDIAISLSTNEWKGKKVVLFAVPGAFTASIMDLRVKFDESADLYYQPTCHINHLPPYIQRYDEFKAKGVDVIAVIAANDPFVMNGWARFEGLKDKVQNI